MALPMEPWVPKSLVSQSLVRSTATTLLLDFMQRATSRSPRGNMPSDNNSHKTAGGNASFGTFKLVLLVMMVLQNSATVLVGRYTRAGVAKEELYEVNHLILVIEITKFVLSAALEFYTTQGKLWKSINDHVLSRPLDALKILVPALLYLVQNSLLYVALSNLTAPIFQVTYQAKLVTTAIVSVIMLQRSYSMQQWICLVMLSLGVAVVVLGEKKAEEHHDHQNLLLGLIAVSIACLSSALAGVYFEKVLKKPDKDMDASVAPPSLWMRNMQLAFYSVLIAFVQGLVQEGSPELQGKPYLHGFSSWAWFLVLLQAGGGMLVAAVIKYADNVLKGLATGVSVVVGTACSTVLFQTPLSSQFSIGATMILVSVYCFSNPLPKAFSSLFPKNHNETESLIPK